MHCQTRRQFLHKIKYGVCFFFVKNQTFQFQKTERMSVKATKNVNFVKIKTTPNQKRYSRTQYVVCL